MPSDTPCPRRSSLLTLALLACLGLAGCGLGSHIDVQPGELHFEAVQGEASPPPQFVKATSVAEQVIAKAPSGQTLPAWLSTVIASGDDESFSFRLAITDTTLPVGDYQTVVRFVTGGDREFDEITVRYTVLDPATHPPISLSPDQVEFTAHTGERNLPGARTVSIATPRGEAIDYSVAERNPGNAPDWLELPPPGTAPQALSVRPSTTALPPGKYTTVLDIIPGNGRTPVPLRVVYTVLEPGTVTPSEASLRVDMRTTDAELAFPGVRISSDATMAWRVVSTDASWLEASILPGSAEVPPSLKLRAVKSALAGLDNGSYSATVTLAYHGAQVPERQLALPVKLTVDLPRVRTVMPYATEAGRSLSHILRGTGFNSLQSGQRLHIGPITTSSYQIISDTEIRLDVPALPVGAHALWVDTVLGLETPGALLHAVQTPAFSEFALDRERSPRRVIYDPLRFAVYSVENTSSPYHMALYRYRHAAGTWQEEEIFSHPDINDIAMNVDGQSLYLSIGAGLYRLDLEDATVTPRLVRAISGYSKLAVLNDGTVLDSSKDCTSAITSPDGRRAAFVPEGCVWAPPRIVDASTGVSREGPVPLSEYLAFDRTAHLVADGMAVYDDQWSLVAGLEQSLYALTFSPDSRRLFGLYADYAISREVLYVYDVSSPPSRGGFSRLAEIPMPGTTQYYALYAKGVVTPDGRTLITANLHRFHVYPVPGELQ